MNYLAIAIITIAVAQLLTILLTIGREREIRRLRELVTEHGVQIAELKAWLAGRVQSAQPRRTRPDREPTREPIADDVRMPEPAIAIAPKDLPNTIRPSTAEDELKRTTKAFKWFKEDADKPRAIIEAREIIAGLGGRVPPELATMTVPEPAVTPKDLPDTVRPRTTEEELERANKAIEGLKEDVDKARAIVAAQQGNRTGPVMPLEIHKAQEVVAEVATPLRRRT